MLADSARKRVSCADVGKEPFRIFFPLGVLAGILGVAFWPVHFAGMIDWYPGEAHARMMACGLFGGFILGFLGTAMPRMLSAPPLGARNVLLLAAIHTCMVAALAIQNITWGDYLFLILLVTFVILMLLRVRHRKDTPPPGVIMVGLALLCVLAGATLAVLQHWNEQFDSDWVALQKLLSYQGFVLLPILGIGPFILPRFFGLESPHDFPEAKVPSVAWKQKAGLAALTGITIVASFFMEVKGWFRIAYVLRFLATIVYLLLEFPFHRAPKLTTALGAALRMAFVLLVSGFIVIALFPQFRVSVLHLTLVGGFAVIIFMVATRVVFGHSGNLEKLRGRNRWLLIAVATMLFAMATRISGDFWPQIMLSHYSYGAVLWIASVLLWSCFVLPKVLQVETE